MKIHILKTSQGTRPDTQSFKYPEHNADYGVEQDFLDYLQKNRHLTTEDPSEANWHYLPIYWTRWHLNHGYGTSGLVELQSEVDSSILDDAKTFTVCQYDDGPLAELGKTVLFLSSRKTPYGIDIPLLSTAHRKPFFRKGKRYMASFAGRLDTHPLRQELAEAVRGRPDVFLYDGNKGATFFVDMMLRSYLALCPRGYGGSSFRLYEAMQLGVVPLLLGELDTRPFRKFLDWDRFSFYTPTATGVGQILDGCSTVELAEMASRARQTYRNDLCFGKWCRFVLKELEELS